MHRFYLRLRRRPVIDEYSTVQFHTIGVRTEYRWLLFLFKALYITILLDYGRQFDSFRVPFVLV